MVAEYGQETKSVEPYRAFSAEVVQIRSTVRGVNRPVKRRSDQCHDHTFDGDAIPTI